VPFSILFCIGWKAACLWFYHLSFFYSIYRLLSIAENENKPLYSTHTKITDPHHKITSFFFIQSEMFNEKENIIVVD